MTTRVLFIFAFFLQVTSVFAQGREVKVPLGANPVLSNYVEQQGEEVQTKKPHQPFGKVAQDAGLFPFIDHFTRFSLDSLWFPTDATKSGQSVVFNALNANNIAYNGGTGTFGQCDVLASDTINIAKSAGGNRLYMMFTYSTGSTWNTGDSLILQFKTGSGVYRTIWSSSAVAVSRAEIILSPIDNQDDYNGVGFNFQFINYSTQTATNTEDYIVHSVVLADKWAFPAYENFYAYDTLNSTPTSNMWAQKTTFRWDGSNVNLYVADEAVNVAIFDAMDEYGAVYNGANGALGYGDTMMSHLMDLTQFAPTDSVYLRFYYRALANVKSTDSLIMEFRQNTGVWIRAWQTGGVPQSDFGTYIQQINFGRLRHANFQFRLISKCSYTASDTLKFAVGGVHIGKKLLLPLFDDFSRSSIYPDKNIWLNKSVYINNDFPIKPPSVNVATFDGLDFRGNPYGTALASNCDTLTSYPLKLSGLTVGDSVYLSFWVEPQGLGYNDQVNIQSVLYAEVRNSPTNPDGWEQVWSAKMPSLPTDTFKQISILVDSAFLHDDFQIRFRNIGSQTGNLDHWHVDYIRVDKGRKSYDPYFDIAINSSPGSLLTPYSSMPRNHFLTNPPSFTKSSQDLGGKNNNNVAYPITYGRSIYAPDNSQVENFSNLLAAFIGLSDTVITVPVPPASPNIGGSFPGDSLIFRSKYTLALSNTTDNIPFNDTLSVNTIFSNYFAYDDGTAENGYAIEKTTGALALAYTLPQPDTLYGMSIFFNRSFTDVSQKTFDLLVYSSINTSGADAVVLLRVPSFTPVYTNKINGFYYYKLAEPLYLPAGTFYIGWEQTTLFSMNIGLDENFQVDGVHNPNPNMYVRLDNVGVWQPTQLTGALMMRPIVGKWLTPPVGLSEVGKKSALDVEVYPNPASNMVYLSSKENAVYSTELIDISGRLIMSRKGVTSQLPLPSCTDGMYFLKITDSKGNSAVKKILIQNY